MTINLASFLAELDQITVFRSNQNYDLEFQQKMLVNQSGSFSAMCLRNLRQLVGEIVLSLLETRDFFSYFELTSVILFFTAAQCSRDNNFYF